MRFATDATLGRLGRHLRAAGFDTLCRHQSRQDDFFDAIDADRIILTRTQAVRRRFLPSRAVVFICDNDPWRQLRQVVRELGIRQRDARPFSRCLACNRCIDPLDKQAVKTRVPAYVWQRQRTFHGCAQCQRIFWAGSHHERMGQRLATLFQDLSPTGREYP